MALLAGIPSVVYGFFGLTAIVPFVKETFGGNGNSMLTACILLAMMILPTIILQAESAIRAVPSYFEGSLALGATREASVLRTVVPAARSGILAAVILGVGRAVGETMAVMMVAGNQARMPKGLLKGIRTMTVNIVMEMGYATDLHREALIATGVVLFVFILLINALFSALKRAGSAMKRVRLMLANAARYPGSFWSTCCAVASLFVAGALALIIGYILITGIPNLKPSLFALEYNSENVSLLPALFNTVIMTLLSLLLAVPLGVGGAIYLAEYANRSSRIVKAVRLTAETLAGIPSILYGLFGMMFFVTSLRWSYSLLAGGMTLAVMILPLILRTTEEALLSIPDSYREGSFGLGAGRLRTVTRIVLPPAMSGILAGVILAIGRVVGETAALIYTAGTVADWPKGVMSSGRTLAVHMYVLSGEGLHVPEASATAVVLLVIVVGMNALSSYVAKKLTRG